MVDEVRATEVSARAGGPATVTALSAGLAEIHRANTRADVAEAKVGELERAAWWTEGQVNVYERRIAALEADKRVSALEVRQASRDRWWVIGVCAVTMVLGFALILALVWATGPR